MKKFYTGIVNHPKTVLGFFLILFILCIGAQKLVSVNYDINDYLPEDTHSTLSIEIMSEEFEGGIPNARVMIKNVTIPEALNYKEQLKAIEGIQAVTWLHLL